MKLFRWVVVFVVVALAMSLAAEQPAAPVKTVVIHAGRLLDVKTGKTLTGQTIIIQGDKITGVGAIGDQKLPSDATVIDLPNATVLPGLIDAHTHITFAPNFGYSTLGISIPRETLTGARNARVTLEAGFTTIPQRGCQWLLRCGPARRGQRR